MSTFSPHTRRSLIEKMTHMIQARELGMKIMKGVAVTA
jgi:hypothetical protein